MGGDVGSLEDVGSHSFGTTQKLFCRRGNPAGPEQVVRVPIRALADRKDRGEVRREPRTGSGDGVVVGGVGLRF